MLKQAHMIGLVAPRPGSGKDTFYEQLQLASPETRLKNVKFAKALENEVYDLFPKVPLADLQWIRNDSTAKDHPFNFLALDKVDATGLITQDTKAYFKWATEVQGYDTKEARSMRWHLVEYGTNFKRKYLNKDSYWLDKGMSTAKHWYDGGVLPVITDVRFPNEAAKVKRVGGILVYIQPDWTPSESGGVADGLISPEDCHITVRNLKVNKTNMVKEFLNEYTI